MHVHTAEGSIRDSCLRADKYIQKCKDLKLDACHISEHGEHSTNSSLIS